MWFVWLSSTLTFAESPLPALPPPSYPPGGQCSYLHAKGLPEGAAVNLSLPAGGVEVWCGYRADDIQIEVYHTEADAFTHRTLRDDGRHRERLSIGQPWRARVWTHATATAGVVRVRVRDGVLPMRIFLPAQTPVSINGDLSTVRIEGCPVIAGTPQEAVSEEGENP